MNDGIEVPAARSGMGCFGKGCVTFLGLVVFLAIALIAGTFWGIHYLRSYSSTEPLPLPTAETSTAGEASGDEQPVPESSALTETEAAPTAPPSGEISHDWKSFEKAARRNEPARIELTADQINTLIAGSDSRGKVSVSIEDNIGRVQVSIPLHGVYMMEGRYLNGEATVAASPDGDPAKARISNVVLSGQAVPESVLDRTFFGWPSIHTTVTNWLEERNVHTFRIQDNRVVGATTRPE
ncbi:MAG TPA: hypothetical protein VK474_07235 [Chthoniobacterales bacterium]|nr:hypothetical protein [Chthoniobacterales bacterium]